MGRWTYASEATSLRTVLRKPRKSLGFHLRVRSCTRPCLRWTRQEKAKSPSRNFLPGGTTAKEATLSRKRSSSGFEQVPSGQVCLSEGQWRYQPFSTYTPTTHGLESRYHRRSICCCLCRCSTGNGSCREMTMVAEVSKGSKHVAC